MTYRYQVEYQDDDDKTHVVPYDRRRTAALAAARRASKKFMVAYVVACKVERDGSEPAVGHKSYGNGLVMETEGEGFAPTQ
jgi:hypothetical protein